MLALSSASTDQRGSTIHVCNHQASVCSVDTGSSLTIRLAVSESQRVATSPQTQWCSHHHYQQDNSLPGPLHLVDSVRGNGAEANSGRGRVEQMREKQECLLVNHVFCPSSSVGRALCLDCSVMGSSPTQGSYFFLC